MGASIVDMDGALFIPFEPVDLSEYTNITNITIDFLWDMTDAAYATEEGWFFTDRVLGTPFDFQVQILVETGA